MALLERVSTLLRANLNDLLDKAEDPQKMLKQLLLDMDNQLLQVKTQVAVAIADQHLLEKKVAEHEASAASWRRKAELALERNDEPLARAALERTVAQEQLLHGYTQQLADQQQETATLRENYTRLRTKLEETHAQGELLLTQHRRARNATKAAKPLKTAQTLNTFRDQVHSIEAQKLANRAFESEASVEDRFRTMEREERIEALLNELRSQPRLLRD